MIRALICGLLLWLGWLMAANAERTSRGLRSLLVLLATAFALRQSVTHRWVADQAYIAFRFSQNLAAGDGLVFNPGERIGALSNPVWAIVLSLAVRCGISALTAAIVLCVASLAAVIVLLGHDARPKAYAPWCLPMAALLAAISSLFWSYGTSGLPAMPSALFVLLGTRQVCHRPARAGIYGAIATLIAPLCGVYVIALGLGCLFRRGARAIFAYFLPLTVGCGVQMLLYRSYFGSFLPFSWTAAALLDSRLERGLAYSLLGICGHGLWSLLPAVCVAVGAKWHTGLARGAVSAIGCYLFVLAWFGGDSLDGHLLLAVLPVILLLAEHGTRELWRTRHWHLAALASLLPGATTLPNTLLKPELIEGRLVDGATFDRKQPSTAAPSDHCASQARELARAFVGSSVHPRVASSCPGVTGYIVSISVVDLTGDLEPHVFLHRSEGGRRRFFIDRHLHAGFLKHKAVDISEIPTWPEQYGSLSRLRIGSLTMNWVQRRDEVMDRLRQLPGVSSESVTEYLQSHQPENSTQRACDVWFLDNFYFGANRVDAHVHERQAWLSRLAFNENEYPFVTAGDSAAPAGWSSTPVEFGASRDFSYRGLGWADWFSQQVPADQADIFGHSRRLLDTYRPLLKESAQGQLQSPEFMLGGDVITIDIGGGMAEDALYVALVIEGQIVRRATGCQSDLMRRAIWDTSRWVGKRARLLWVDQHTGPWGHLLTGDVLQWRRTSRLATGTP